MFALFCFVLDVKWARPRYSQRLSITAAALAAREPRARKTSKRSPRISSIWPGWRATTLPYGALRAAMRSMRSAIRRWLSAHHIYTKTRPVPLARVQKKRCASPTLPLRRPAAYRTLSCAAIANGEPGCERYFHSPASRCSRLMKR